jgi:CRP/FNR family transcriptional regulator, cyclic AMP receptor protein
VNQRRKGTTAASAARAIRPVKILSRPKFQSIAFAPITRKGPDHRCGSGNCDVESVVRSELDKARELLGSCSLFRGLGPEEKKALVARAKMRGFAAGQSIFLMGSSYDSMMAVLNGSVKISVFAPDGKELMLAILQPEEVFGEIALLDGKERSAAAVAMTDCTLAVLERADVLSFLESYPGAWRRLVEVLCARLRHTDQHFVEIALLQLPVRLARTMLRTANVQHHAALKQKGERIKLSQRDLGSMVGATREAVNKCFQEWRRAGIVQIDRGGIAITDRAALEAVAEQD